MAQTPLVSNLEYSRQRSIGRYHNPNVRKMAWPHFVIFFWGQPRRFKICLHLIYRCDRWSRVNDEPFITERPDPADGLPRFTASGRCKNKRNLGGCEAPNSGKITLLIQGKIPYWNFDKPAQRVSDISMSICGQLSES